MTSKKKVKEGMIIRPTDTDKKVINLREYKSKNEEDIFKEIYVNKRTTLLFTDKADHKN